jgi:hypothetical protein
MKNQAFFRTLIVMSVAGLIAVGCIARGDTVPEVDVLSYEQALERFPGDPAGIEPGLSRFRESYADLTSDDLVERMSALYAESMFFNDTLHTFQHRDDLLSYLERTGTSLSESTVEVRQVMSDGPDVFVRWTMSFRTRALGQDIHSQSIGMTHLRFDVDGRVVLHQDFWDSGHALYAHLPFVGFAVRRARDRL